MSEYQHVRDFLACKTPQAWLDVAVQHMDLLLIDHAHCEKKAASTALNLMFRYVDKKELLFKLSQLAREELLHFEQVIEFCDKRNVQYDHLSPSRYAQGMRKHIRTFEPAKLIDTLIVGAFIEARSCERFEALAPYVDEELSRYYQFLLKSESRHFTDYLELAELYNKPDECGGLQERVDFFREVERELIESPDQEVRFHSGPLTL